MKGRPFFFVSLSLLAGLIWDNPLSRRVRSIGTVIILAPIRAAWRSFRIFLLYHPHSLYVGVVLLVVALFLAYLYIFFGWRFEWNQIGTWANNHKAIILVWLETPFVIIALINWVHHAFKLHWHRGIHIPNKVAQQRHHAFVSLSVLVLVIFSLVLYFSTVPNLQASHGCSDTVTITTNTTWSTNQCHGDVTVKSGATLTINGGITANLTSLTLGEGGGTPTNGFITAKGDTVNNVGVTINLDGDFTSLSGSNISANNQGYTVSYNGPGAGQASPKTSAGHGGQGGTDDLSTTAGGTYGSVTAPTTLGSSGDQLTGGGAIKLSIGGNASVGGNITADVGSFNNSSVTVSAGGSVWLNFTGGSSTLSGAGTISANGGTNTSGKAGGGGRIAITGYTTNSHTGTVSAYGGGGASNRGGAAGTIYTKSTAETNGTLIVDNGGTNTPQEARYTSTGTLTVDTLTIRNRGVVTFATGNTVTATTTTIASNGQLHPHIAHDIGGAITVQNLGKISHAANTNTETYKIAGLTLTNLTIDSGGSIDLNNKGYQTDYSGPGAGSASPKTAAGHGGQGATDDTTNATAGVTYDSVTAPVNIGSSGSSNVNGTDGEGGGAAKFNISGNASITGNITANGSGINNAGFVAGAGGSIWLNFTGGSSTLSGAGAITANGGDDTVLNGNSGGGGRIAITGYTSNTHSGTLSAAGGDGPSGKDGVAGTVHTKSTSQTNGTLIIDNSSSARVPQDYRLTGIGTLTMDTITLRNGGILTIKTGDTVTATTTTIASGAQLHPRITHDMGGSITVQSTGKIAHPPNTNTETYKITNLTLTNLTVDSGGGVDVDGKGYTTTYSGPGAGNATDNAGAGHGGQGSAKTNTNSTYGATYDSMTQPSNIGSSGTTAGGGAIRLTISGNATINGTITADGTLGSFNTGAGGSVWIAFTGGSSTLSGSGSISADGGVANNGEGQGGGGRVTITGYSSNTLSGAISAYGGSVAVSPTVVGAPGTVLTKSASETNGTLKIDNQSRNSQAGKCAEVGTTATVDTLTLQNGALCFGVSSGGNVTLVNNLTLSVSLRNRGTFTHQGSLTIASGGIFIGDSAATLGAVTIQSGGKINHTANSTAETYKVDITASSLTIDSGGSVDVASLGYTGGAADVNGNGTGGGSLGGALSGGGGAGHGGTGSAGQGASGGAGGTTYGSSTTPVTIGSGGGGGDSAAGGPGGGAVKLNITNALTVNGTINANGGNGVTGLYGGGGGSGGSIYLLASSLTCAGSSITANGGSGAGTTASGGGGAGGRVNFSIGTSYSCAPVVTNGSYYQAPAAPTNFSISSYTATTTTLSWKDGSTTETKFNIHDSSHTVIGVKTSTTTSGTGADYTSTFTGLTPDTTYSYHVHANDDLADGFGTSTASVRTPAQTPGSTTLSNHLNNQLLLTFDPTNNPSSVQYTIRETISGKYVQANGTLGDTTTPVWQTYSAWGGSSGITITGLSKATLYTFGVKARNSDNVETGYQSKSSVEPNTPIAPILFDPAATEIGLALGVDGNPSVVEYAIYESTTNQYISTLNNGIFARLGSSPLWKTYVDWGEYFGINVQGLTANTTYKFKVKARYPGGTETAFGPEATLATNSEPVPTGDSSSTSTPSTSGGTGGTATSTPVSSTQKSSGGGASSGGTSSELTGGTGGDTGEVTFAERKRLTFAEFFKQWRDYWIEQQYDWWDSNSFFGGSGWFGSTVGGSIGWGLLPWGQGSAGGKFRSRGGFGSGGGFAGPPGGGPGGGFGGGGPGGPGGGGGGPGRGGRFTPGKMGGGAGKLFRGLQSGASMASSLFGGLDGPFVQITRKDDNATFRFPTNAPPRSQTTPGGPGDTSSDSGDIPSDGSGNEPPFDFDIDQRITDIIDLLKTLINIGLPNALNPLYTQEVFSILEDYVALAKQLADIFAETRVAGYLEEAGITAVNRFVAGLAILSFAAPLVQVLSSFAGPLMTSLIPGAGQGGFWFNVLSWRKRRKSWGRVVSSLTGRGVSGAVVSLYSASTYNRLVDRVTTNRFGRFSFLVTPGNYILQASHPKYRYPSTSFASGYRGQILTVKEDGIIQIDIPVDPLKVFPVFITAGEIMRLLFEILRRVLLVLGTVLSLYNISREVTVLNVIFLIYYIALWIWELVRKKESHNAVTILDAKGKPVAYAIVRLLNRAGEVVFTKASGSNGKVFIIIQEGLYTLDVTVPAMGAHVRQYVELSNGILPKPLVIRLGQARPPESEPTAGDIATT